MNCMIASGMADVMDEIYLNLNDMCLEKLKTITIGEIERKPQLKYGRKTGRKQQWDNSSARR